MNNTTFSPEERLRELAIVLPTAPAPVGNFLPVRREGGLLFLSGQGPLLPCGRLATGKVGENISADEARNHARCAGMVLLAAMRESLGSLNRVVKMLKILGMVNAAPDFCEHPAVINGCSDLFVDVFGEAGRHARSAVGVASLPNGITVEVEAVAAVAE